MQQFSKQFPKYQLRITWYDKDIWKIKNPEKLSGKNKTSPLLKTPEKDFHFSN